MEYNKTAINNIYPAIPKISGSIDVEEFLKLREYVEKIYKLTISNQNI